MPVYSYTALNAVGRTVKGITRADSAKQARLRLRSEGLHPVDIRVTDAREDKKTTRTDRSRFKLRRGPSSIVLAETTRQLHTLMSAGIPLVDSLSAVHEQSDDSAFARVLALVRENVTEGHALADALAEHPRYFPNDYIHLIRAGELGGKLDEVLGRLAESLERGAERMSRVRAALAYPIFMTVVGIGVLAFLFTFIVPTLTGLFETLDAALPWPTRVLLFLSGIMKSYWWAVLIVLVAGGLLFRNYLKNKSNYRRVELVLFKVPVFGALIQKLLLGRVFRSLSVMVGGGVPLTNSLGVTAKGMGRSNFAKAMETAEDMVGQGRSLADGLAASGLFPPVTRRMIAIGETSGSLPEMLSRAAKAHEDQTDRALTTLTSLVEPVIILTMGLVVGFVVLAVLLPVFDLSTLVR